MIRALDDGTQLVTTTFRGFDQFHTTAILLLRNPFISLVADKQDPDGTLGITLFPRAVSGLYFCGPRCVAWVVFFKQ